MTDEGCMGNGRGTGQAHTCDSCTPEIPQAAIEAAARQLHVDQWPGAPWGELTEESRSFMRRRANASLAAALPHLLTKVVVHHYDIEKHAASFNEGYDEANRQGIGGEASRNWLTEKVWPLLKDHIEPENSHHVADQIADALLSEVDLEPSEVKSMCETATKVALGLGRREALTEAEAAANKIAEECNGKAKTHRQLSIDKGGSKSSGGASHMQTALAFSNQAASAWAVAEAVREIASQAPQSASNGLTASSRHPGTPEDTKPPQEGS